MKVVLLGPQRLGPTLKDVVASLGIDGRIAVITAGWQEHESDDQELCDHLGQRAVNLLLHARAEAVFRKDATLTAAHRARQERLQRLQQSYAIRLEHAYDAARLIARRETDPELLEQEEAVSLDLLRTLDNEHLARCDAIHQEFDALWHPQERPSVKAERDQLRDVLAGCDALVIAGGHVAVLLNRLRLFDVFDLRPKGGPLIAWSAGAMALSERVVLFHDDPPYGPGLPEVLARGFGLAPGVVPLPHAQRRLRLEDRTHVSQFARRFAPAVCLSMADGAQVIYDSGRWGHAQRTQALQASGALDKAWAT